MNHDANITIIGAGVIGLAIAEKLSKSFENIFVLEKNDKFGQETSSRNSEVIHSGIYYPTNSLKAKLCVEGNKLLYDYCQKNEINYRKCGKLVVATESSEEEILQKVLKQSKINGVTDGKLLINKKIKELEPNISCVSAIYFSSTGIVDSHGLMKSFESNSIINGVNIVYKSEVIRISNVDGGYEITVSEQGDEYSFTTGFIINTAGLYSDNIAKMTNTYIPTDKLYYWRGDYFAVSNSKNKLINHLIYPVPHANNIGLGVHATLDLNHGMKLGPNAIFLENNQIEYVVDKSKQKDFYNSAKKFLPFLELDDLHPDQAGIRPKLQKPGDPTRDFIIRKETKVGHPNIINLIGIESPGLTSCLAIADYVRNLLIN